MEREFNDTGLCVPEHHYMADTAEKIADIFRLVEKGKYFAINRPRQFGKSTILSQLAKKLNAEADYAALQITFEEMDAEAGWDQRTYIREILMMLAEHLNEVSQPDAARFIEAHINEIFTFPALSRFIVRLIQKELPGKAVILLIDEVDKNSDNPLFLTFLGILRNQYLKRSEGRNAAFHSVILAGVHDIRTLKTKIRADDRRKYNSPWNIAVDFEVDLCFTPGEIEYMLSDYAGEKGIRTDIQAIAERLHHYTGGYPWLVSKLCKFIDEKIIVQRTDRNWLTEDVDTAFRMIVDGGYSSTLFDSLIKKPGKQRCPV